MRHQVDVRIASARPVSEVWTQVCDVAKWAPMPGAELALTSEADAERRIVRFSIQSGLPVRDHAGTVTLARTEFGGTEIVIHEGFRARIWGTGGYLRARRERALLDLARSWGDASLTPRLES